MGQNGRPSPVRPVRRCSFQNGRRAEHPMFTGPKGMRVMSARPDPGYPETHCLWSATEPGIAPRRPTREVPCQHGRQPRSQWPAHGGRVHRGDHRVGSTARNRELRSPTLTSDLLRVQVVTESFHSSCRHRGRLRSHMLGRAGKRLDPVPACPPSPAGLRTKSPYKSPYRCRLGPSVVIHGCRIPL
jgi:hypothetical protein